MNNDLISRSALKEHKFVGNKYMQIGGRTNGKTLENINKAYQQGWNDAIDAIIDNAPTVEAPENTVNCVLTEFGNCSYNKTGCSDCEIKNKIRKALNERPQSEWIEFARWVASEVLDNYFEENSGAFAEIACRRLVNLGLVEIKDNVYKMKGDEEE